jgi:hypothetical protein
MLGDYARRFNDSGVPGAFHLFDKVFHKAEMSRTFWHRQAKALADALAS